MEIKLPYAGIVLLVGPSNSGKSTLLEKLIGEKQILPSEVVSSDSFRVLVGDVEYMDWKERPKDEADGIFDEYQKISKEAFALLDSLIEKRCRLNKLTFVDATHLYSDDRKRYIELARRNNVPIMSLVLDVELDTLIARDEVRDNSRGKRRIKQQYQVFKKEKRFIKKEGYLAAYFISDIEKVELVRTNDNPLELDVGNGIDIVGDIHGCFDEMIQLLEILGYEKNEEDYYVHPEGRKILALGDVMSRGPKSLETMLFFLKHINNGYAYMIDSNHGWKIARWLDGRRVTLTHGDELVEEEFRQFQQQNGEERTSELKQQIKQMLLKAPSHYVITKNGVPTLICTHAGIRDDFIGKSSYEISDFCRYGDTDGLDVEGKPIRKDWTIHHKKSSLIIWGHDPKPKPLINNNTINIDQGVVFGGELTAFRYPEKEFVSVQAEKDYSDGVNNPLVEWKMNRLNPPHIARFINGYSVLTEELGKVSIPKKHAIPAIDMVSHYTVPIEELVYIPPTMSPTPITSSSEDYLEHPKEAIDYYLGKGITRMIAEKKHMGSRGILLLFKDKKTALKWIGRETLGVIYTRTGRKFFREEIENEVLGRMNEGLNAHEYFTKYDTEFVLIDAEIMPWNLKAKELISNQYAHVSENAILDRSLLKNKLEVASSTNQKLASWLREYEEKLDRAYVFKDVFQKYCWDVKGTKGIQIAPFHVLAHSKETFFHKTHIWHMEMNREFAKMVDIFVETEYMVIDSEASADEVINWWKSMTSDGHEGIVIKPEFFVSTSEGKLVQPAIKVRGRKYLNIIYGMDYLLPENLTRLKNRNVGKKQKLALKEFALGIEGVKRFVDEETLERVHECVLGTLAMETDPVDPRL